MGDAPTLKLVRTVSEEPVRRSVAPGVRRSRRVVSVGGGKGGIGKSLISANLGIELARRGKKVVLVDADLGGANLHTTLGIDLPRRTLWYFDRTRSGDNIVEQACHILDLMVWTIGKPPLRAYGAGGITLFQDEPPGRTTMDNYSVIYEFPGEVRLNFNHVYFDPPGFTGIRELVFGSEGAIDLPGATWHPRTKRQTIKLDVPNAGQDSSYMSLAAFIDNIRANNRTPLNNAESAMVSTIVPIMATKAIYGEDLLANHGLDCKPYLKMIGR